MGSFAGEGLAGMLVEELEARSLARPSTYKDGCNSHEVFSPAAVAPFIALTQPESTALAYDDFHTLNLCLD
jgi:hypothetical protein